MSRVEIMTVAMFRKQLGPEFLERPPLEARIELMLTRIDHLAMDLQTHWMLYKQLFKEPSNSHLLRRNGSLVFGVLQRLLFDSILLAIARLTDRKISSGQENLSVPSLFEYLSRVEGVTSDIAGRFATKRDRFLEHAKKIRGHRHKRLAHNDAGLLLRESSADLFDIAAEDVDQALRALHEFLEIVQEHFHMRLVDYNVLHEFGTDGAWLLRRLRTLDNWEGQTGEEITE